MLVQKLYQELPSNVNKFCFSTPQFKAKDINELDVKNAINLIYGKTKCTLESPHEGLSHLSPKALVSLKVLSELPIIVVLMYQLYKINVEKELNNFIPLIMNTINLQPTLDRSTGHFNKEIYVDFNAAQIKALSFLAYVVKLPVPSIRDHSQKLIAGFLSLLQHCPPEVAHLRKELLVAAKHILATDLKNSFVPDIERLFDEKLLISNGWTAHETLRPLAFSTIADLVHHVRFQLTIDHIASAINLFSKNLHDETLPTYMQTVSCKLLLNLADCLAKKADEQKEKAKLLQERTKAKDEVKAIYLRIRDLLIKMLEVLVLKFKSVAQLQILMAKNAAGPSTHHPTGQPAAAAGQSTGNPPQQNSSPSSTIPPPTGAVPPSASASTTQPATGQTNQPEELKTFSFPAVNTESLNKDEKSKFGFPQLPSANYTITECRILVKTLVCAVKNITFTTPAYNIDAPPQQLKSFQPKETIIFIRLLKYGMQALDIYTLMPGTNQMAISAGGQMGFIMQPQQRTNLLQTVKSKEEKEILEMFSEIFQMLSPQMFQEIFTISIEFMVERIYHNNALQIIASTFLANVQTSPIFATILVEFLLSRLEEMGSNIDKSNLYLRLFKLVFGSVSMFAQENEKMLKPHLHNIVNKSMKYALCAKEPYNYFLMLRALFRSIGGGSHDLLYQEFLPLLPSLLQGLNSLQSGLHKQHMKDLFVELCLTVPVRLSSLLPYLPMLMDPLVSALNGTQTLVSQGLRTLELCVDNLQPDFLYDHIQPVRAELMQALWRTLRNPQDSIAQISFRVLGKFGGGNRKMMTEPQKLEYAPFKETQNNASTVQIFFTEYKQSIELRLDKIIETAFNSLNGGASLKAYNTDSYYRKQCWEVIKGFLIAHMQMNLPGQFNEKQLSKSIKITQLFSHPSFSVNEIPSIQTALYKLRDQDLRKTHEMALTGMFLATAIKELYPTVLPFMVNVVRHYTLVATSQQAGPINLTNKQSKLSGMDPLVIIDAVASIMGHEEKELCKPGHLAMMFIIDTANSVLKSRERACALPLCEYLVEKMCALCYERAWYAKVGGCIAIKSLFERMTLKWVLNHQYVFLKALFFVMMDLSGEVSNGAIDMAKTNLEKLLNRCAAPLEPNEPADVVEAQKKSLNEVTIELVRHITQANTFVREQAISSLHILARVQNKTISQIIEPHKDILADLVPPKKHLLKQYPVQSQIGLMDGNTFCLNLQPKLFTLDISINEHRAFFIDVFNLCENEDSVLNKHPSYKNCTDLVPLRRSALHALSSFHFIEQHKEKIFSVLFKALDSKHPEIQEAGFECMKKFIENTRIEVTIIHNYVKPLIKEIAPKSTNDSASNSNNNIGHLTMNLMQRLSYMTQLFPNIFTEILCHQMYQYGQGLLSDIVKTQQQALRQDKLKILVAIVNLFHQVPAASDKFVEKLLSLVFLAEKMVMIEAGSQLREPLRKFLARYPEKTIELLLKECNIKEDQIYRFLKYLLSGANGTVFRQILMNNPAKLIRMASGPITVQQEQPAAAAAAAQQAATTAASGEPAANADQSVVGQPPTTTSQSAPPPVIQTVSYELDFQAVLITNVLVKYDKTWLNGQEQLVEALKKIWLSDEFMAKHTKFETLDYGTWKQPKLIVKCLLAYFQQKPNEEILLLFNLLRVFMYRFVCDFDFFRKYLEQNVCHFAVDWKRAAFFKFKEIFRDTNYPQELKAKVLQYIIIPMFATSFEKGETEQLIGGPPEPDEDSPDNLISIFINDIIILKSPFRISDSVRIFILQLSCLLLEQASAHIHDAANKRQGVKLKLLMTYAWPCLVANNCVDPATKYLGRFLDCCTI